MQTFFFIVLLLLVSGVWFVAGAIVHNLYPPTTPTLTVNTDYLKLGVYLSIALVYTIGLAISLRYWGK